MIGALASAFLTYWAVGFFFGSHVALVMALVVLVISVLRASANAKAVKVAVERFLHSAKLEAERHEQLREMQDREIEQERERRRKELERDIAEYLERNPTKTREEAIA